MTLATRFAPVLVLATSLAHAGSYYPDPFTTVTTRGGFDSSFSVVNEQGAIGAVALHTDGSIWNHVFTGTQPVDHELRWGVSSRGVSAVLDQADPLKAVYVFSAESDGLWYLRVTAEGTAWDAWCHVETRNDILSAPSAIYTDSGYVRVYAQSATNHLLQWRLTPTPNTCVHVAADDRSDILVTSPPQAVSWLTSNSFGRIDVFATFYDHVVHAWKAETVDDHLYDELQAETTMWVNGVHQQIKVEPGTAMSATAMGTGMLDALFRAPDGWVSHLSWRQAPGFQTEEVFADATDSFEIDGSRDPNLRNTPPAYIAHGCVDESVSTIPQCRSYGMGAAGSYVPTTPFFPANHVLAMHGYTDLSATRWLFVVDADSHQLRYTKGNLTSGY